MFYFLRKSFMLDHRVAVMVYALLSLMGGTMGWVMTHDWVWSIQGFILSVYLLEVMAFVERRGASAVIWVVLGAILTTALMNFISKGADPLEVLLLGIPSQLGILLLSELVDRTVLALRKA